MISRNFYNNPANKAQLFLNGALTHWSHKDRYVVIDKYQYVIKYGESIYSLASDIFGADRQYLWPIISDINKLKKPDEWEVGDVIWLPSVIVNDLRVLQRKEVNGLSR